MNAAAWLQGFQPPDRWRGAFLARAPQIATWVLALAIAVQAAMIVTNLSSIDSSPLADVPPPPPAAAQRRIDVVGIANSHLFGEAKVEPTESSAADAPQTNIPLVLTGIIAADDPRTGLAIVGESAPTARVRAVGDSLPGGVTLHSVYGDRVLLDRGGRLEALVLPRQFAGTPGAAPPPPPPTTMPSSDPAIERMRQLVTDEPSLVSDIMRQQPVFAQGKQRGYRVYPGRNRQAFMRLGLRPGDLVTAINGTPLDDPARGNEVFRTIGSSSEARITVMRNGRQQELTLNMGQIAAEADQLLGQPGLAEQPAASPNPQNDE
jgi:general secretion pathway protein C